MQHIIQDYPHSLYRIYHSGDTSVASTASEPQVTTADTTSPVSEAPPTEETPAETTAGGGNSRLL